ncbi:MAG: hypothetical protein JSS50_05005 [Proteobacteria bacterium]|nr:hypothetical protein [Pseudomonadota bacterium]
MLARNKHILHVGVPLLVSGAVLLGTGVGLAASGGQASVVVGSTNLPMFLAFSGAAALLAGGVIANNIFYKDGKDEEPKTLNRCIWKSSYAVTSSLLNLSGTYFGVHLGIGQLLPTTLTVWESLGIKAAIEMPIVLLLSMIINKLHEKSNTWRREQQYTEDYNREMPIIAFTFSLAAAAAVTLGPALTTLMGTAASTVVEKIALEIIIATAMLSLALPMGELMKDLFKPGATIKVDENEMLPGF